MLEQALLSWSEQCDAASDALEAHDLDRVEAALGAREVLRPRIATAIELLRAQSPTGSTLRSIERLQERAARAETRLVELLDRHRDRLRQDMDSAPHVNAGASAYARVDAANPHRLDIRR